MTRKKNQLVKEGGREHIHVQSSYAASVEGSVCW